jgi:LytS/YehU family sensor histidine kinase
VENALKHGIGGLVEGGEVEIGAQRSGELMTVWVANPFDPEGRKKSGSGVGLANVRERLHNAYGDGATLRSERSGDIYRAEVVIPVPAVGDEAEAKGTSDV